LAWAGVASATPTEGIVAPEAPFARVLAPPVVVVVEASAGSFVVIVVGAAEAT